MQKERKDKHFIKQPVYKGGMKAMKVFIKEHLRYPEKALAAKVEGSVYLKYTINHKGKVIETRVVSSLGHGCDEEAARIVKLLEFEVPKARGVKVLYHKNVQIHFRLPKGKKVKPEVQEQQAMQYQLVPASKGQQQERTSKKSYTITINLP